MIYLLFYMVDDVQQIKKKRGRKSKKELMELENAKKSQINNENQLINQSEIKQPKKRGRKPKGGKILVSETKIKEDIILEQNIVLHLKCNSNDLTKNKSLSNNIYDPNIPCVESYQFEDNKLNYLYINNNMN